jgi:hypothetical protein
MKKVLIFTLLLYCNNIYAQSMDFTFGGGISTNTYPNGNMEYVGDKMLLNYSATAKYTYTSKTSWQVGLDWHMLELSAKSSKKYAYYHNRDIYIDSVGGDGKKLVYAKFAHSLCFVGNRMFKFESGGGVYAGLALGYGFARNNSVKFYSNEGYKGPDGGHGFTYGLQLGIVKNFSEKIAFNFEVAARYYNFQFDAEAPQRFPPELLHYSIMSFPITIGLRYYLFNIPENAAGTMNLRRGRYY